MDSSAALQKVGEQDAEVEAFVEGESHYDCFILVIYGLFAKFRVFVESADRVEPFGPQKPEPPRSM
jgi:hypothetical protein